MKPYERFKKETGLHAYQDRHNESELLARPEYTKWLEKIVEKFMSTNSRVMKLCKDCMAKDVDCIKCIRNEHVRDYYTTE